ncbi:MAG: lasso peptide biosynthesis B2 protein [bacterium]
MRRTRPPTPWLLTAKAWLIFVWLDILFRFKGFQYTYDSVVRRSAGSTGGEVTDDEAVDRAVAAVQAATKLYWRSRRDCLPRSLTLYRLLRDLDVPARVCIGVKKYPFFLAHAWVELEGRPLDENPGTISELSLLSRA